MLGSGPVEGALEQAEMETDSGYDMTTYDSLWQLMLPYESFWQFMTA